MQVVKIAGQGGDQITETSSALDVNIKSGSSGLPDGAATSAKQDALFDEVALFDVGEPQRIVNDGTSKAVTVPAAAKMAVVDAEGGDVRLEIDGDATATSTIRIPEDTIRGHPISGGDQTLASWGAVGSIANVRFLGVL